MKKYFDKFTVLYPKPSEVTPKLTQLKNIKAVIFDIYGTLLISASGDIGQSKCNINAIKKALLPFAKHKEVVSTKLAEEIFNSMRFNIELSHKKGKKKGIKFPEINIIDIWETVLTAIFSKHPNILKKNINFKEFAFVFEFYTNPVYPMPGLNDLLPALKNKNIKLGIISNAQFFTPIILSFFLNEPSFLKGELPFFEKDISIFSYIYAHAKPGIYLYEKCLSALNSFNILPNEILYVGNDMLNDIMPAKNLGFKTALFAGDKRSLRLRKDNQSVKNIEPDIVITNLMQIKGLFC